MDAGMHPAAHRAPVLLLHGLCSTPDELRPLASALKAGGHTVHNAWIPGYSFDVAAPGRAAAPWQQWIDAVAAQVEALHRTHGRVVLAGLSAGASLVLGALPSCRAWLAGAVLMSTSLLQDGWAIPRRMRHLLPLALYTPLGLLWRYREKPPYGVKNERVRQWIARELLERQISRAGAATIDVDYLRELDRLHRHLRRRLATLQAPPTLLLHAREDEIASPSNVALIERQLSCESLRTVMLDNSYHMITIDNDRQQVVGEVVDFAGAVGHPRQPFLSRGPEKL